jgi:excisionase family DNA binding protein
MTPEEKAAKKAAKKARAWLLDPEQASELLGISRSSVVRLIVDGQLPAICLRSGRRKKVWRIRREVLEKWVLNKERQGVKPVSNSNGGAHVD